MSQSAMNQRRSPQIDVFTELDPLGTGLIKPYIDKKDFFQHLKNPPKRVLKDLVTTSANDTFPTNFNISAESIETAKILSDSKNDEFFEDNNFADFERFDENEIGSKMDPTPEKSHQCLSVSLPPEDSAHQKSSSGSYGISNSTRASRLEREPSEDKYTKKYGQSSRRRDFDVYLSLNQSVEKQFPVDFSATSESPASPLRSCSSDANSRMSSSSAELDPVPEPPPRGVGSIVINPPPLPPKKQIGRGTKPPPRPPHSEGHFHYDFLEREETSPSPTSKDKSPSKDLGCRFDDNFSPPPITQLPKRTDSKVVGAFEDSFNFIMPSTILQNDKVKSSEASATKPTLNITLNQLTSTNLAELAENLNMSVTELTSLTLQQLTECLNNLAAKNTINSSRDDVNVKTINNQTKFDLTEPTSAITGASVSFSVQSLASADYSFKANFNDVSDTNNSNYDKYAVFRELLEMEKMKSDEIAETNEDDTSGESETQASKTTVVEVKSEPVVETIASLANLKVNLPPDNEGKVTKTESYEEGLLEVDREKLEEDSSRTDKEESELKLPEIDTEDSTEAEEQFQDAVDEMEDKLTESILKETDPMGGANKFQASSENLDEMNGSSAEKGDVRSSTSTSSDRYAALREIMEESEQLAQKTGDSVNLNVSPVPSSANPAVEVELLNLFSDPTPPAESPKKLNKKEDLKEMAMNIFEEIKMLNTGLVGHKSNKTSGFEDVFCPFPATNKSEKQDSFEQGNWAKFDKPAFYSEKSMVESSSSIGGTSPWSPDTKDIHKEPPFNKPNVQRYSGDSDNEWEDEEESEESNGKSRGDERFWCNSRQARFETEERSFYDDSPGSSERDRSFRDRQINRKPRGIAWPKTAHRSRDPSPWHEEAPRWEEDHRRYHHRIGPPPPRLDDEEYKAHWKCRQSRPRQWNSEREEWVHEHPVYEEERGKRKMMLWSEDESREPRDARERFSSQESMGYEDEERWVRREYERRRWDKDGRYWMRRHHDTEYSPRESYRKQEPHYYRDSRERQYDYPPGWEEEYDPDRPDESLRYLPRKRHWPKRPNSAADGRNTEVVYAEPRTKFGMTRSECSDNDSELYMRPNRSRSRESYWGSDQEFDSWGERPAYWTEGPEGQKAESLHRRRINRHKINTEVQKPQNSPFEDDFTQSTERSEQADSTPATPRICPEQELKQPPLPPKNFKEHPKRDPRCYKKPAFFEELASTGSGTPSEPLERQRRGSESLKTMPEELPSEIKDPPSADSFVSEDSGRDSFFNGDLRFEDDAFAFKSEMEDSVPDTTLPLKNSTRQAKYVSSKKSDQYIRKSESVNIFVRENDPFDDDDFFN